MITKNNGDNSQIHQPIWKKVLLLFAAALVLFLLTDIFSEFSFYLGRLIYPRWQHLDPDGVICTSASIIYSRHYLRWFVLV